MPHQDKRDTREELLNAGVDLFSEFGFASVSVRDITRRIGVNESTLYNHFKSKDELLGVIIDRFRNEFGRAFAFDANELERTIDGVTPEAFLHHHVLALRDRMTPRVLKTWRIIYLELFRNAAVRGFYLREAMAASVRFYEKAFGIMMDKGMVRRCDPKALAQEFNSALAGLQLENLLIQADGGDTAGNAAGIIAHIRFVCDAVRPKEEERK